MQLHLDGSNSLNASRDSVYAKLTDPNFLVKTIPDAQDAHVLDANSLEAKLKLRVGVVSSSLKMKMTVADRQPTSRASLIAEGTGSGSNIKINSTFTLEGDAPTTMKWSADAEITGVMAGLGSTLLKGFATKRVAEIFEGITKAIEAGS